MSIMDGLGLPDSVLDILIKQKNAEGVELVWNIGGCGNQVEVNLIWRPVRGTRWGGNNVNQKYKSPKNFRRDYYRLKRRLVELNSVCVGTDDFVQDDTEGEKGTDNTLSHNTSPISTPQKVNPLNVEPTFECEQTQSMTINVQQFKPQVERVGAKTTSMALETEKEIIRHSSTAHDLDYFGTPEKCDTLMKDSFRGTSDLDISQVSQSTYGSNESHASVTPADLCVQTLVPPCDDWFESDDDTYELIPNLECNTPPLMVTKQCDTKDEVICYYEETMPQNNHIGVLWHCKVCHVSLCTYCARLNKHSEHPSSVTLKNLLFPT